MAFVGCHRDEVQVYQVAKETSVQPVAASADNDGGANGTPRLQWKTPAGWQEGQPNQVRLASFRIIGKDKRMADVSVVPLGGAAGTDLANVNRWREQVGLQPITEEQVYKAGEKVDIGGQAGVLFDQAGKDSKGDKARILAALLRRDGVSWFFKMTGDDELVAQQKPTFVEFLKSVVFSVGPLTTTSTELPPDHPPIGGAGTLPSVASGAVFSGGKPTWEVPAGWQEIPNAPFLVAKFTISGSGNAQAAVNVTMSGGDGGGLAANVNRWRGQLGLSAFGPVELEKQVQTLDAGDGKAMLIEMSGMDSKSGQPTRLIGVMVLRANETWSYKLMGNEQLVEQQKGAFVKFIQTTKYP